MDPELLAIYMLLGSNVCLGACVVVLQRRLHG